ncbi:MAG: tetratricopeptide repeat protein [Proteobacteria bacterium]|nr:tetratricopeptide repeat protein [Pseudomonadota bacterium]
MDGSVGEVLAQAVQRYVAGDLAQAVPLFQDVLKRDPANAIANHQLGLIAFQAGHGTLAADLLRQATASDPTDPEYHNNLGVVLNAMRDLAGARAAFERAVALKPDYIHALNNLGSVYEADGAIELAIETYRRALAIDPGYVEARDNLDLACSKVVPQWHFPMMHDAPRNDAYDRALRRVAAGRHVLDIGTGAGLLSMMAARAGARRVPTCEAVPLIAARAQAVIARNNLADRITLHAKRSDALIVGVDLPERAEVLVTEIFASGVLSEHVLPTLEHARAHLLTPDATIIPRVASTWCYLAGGAALEAQLFVFEAAGFDTAPFNDVAPHKLGMHLDRVPHDVLSDDIALFQFDLTQPRFAPERRIIEVTARRAGRCVGVAQWLKLELDATTSYENRPRADAGANGWMHVLYRFPAPLDVVPGSVVRLLASHNRTAMTVALAP